MNIIGCANLYSHAPENATSAAVVCKEASIQMRHMIDMKMYDGAKNNGIKYIETGSDAWVVLYAKENFRGVSLVIEPLQTINMEKILLEGNSVKSVQIFRRKDFILFEVNKAVKPPSPHCAIFYLEDPTKVADSAGLVACGDPNNSAKKKTKISLAVTSSDLQNFGFDSLQDYGILTLHQLL